MRHQIDTDIKWFLLAILTFAMVSCAPYTHDKAGNEGGIVGSGNAINCDLHPDNEICRKRNIQSK